MRASSERPRPRRTQRERRETTIARLIDATFAALVDVGYARASVREICGRAGVSDGALFRHFDTRLDIIVACADHVADQTLQDLAAIVDSTPSPELTPGLIVSAIRQATRRSHNQVWQELLIAARTDPELRRRIQPATQRYIDHAQELMQSITAFDAFSREQLGLWQQVLTHIFNSEALVAAIAPNQFAEDRLAEFVTSLFATATAAAAPPRSPRKT